MLHFGVLVKHYVELVLDLPEYWLLCKGHEHFTGKYHYIFPLFFCKGSIPKNLVYYLRVIFTITIIGSKHDREISCRQREVR